MRRTHPLLLALTLTTLVGTQGAAQTTEPAATESVATETAGPKARTDLEASLNETKWYPASGKDLADLLRGCEEGSCMSFVAGAMSGLATKSFLMGETHPFCDMDSVGLVDLRDAIVRVVDGDPQLAQGSSVQAILATFAQTWPCDPSEQGAAAAEDVADAAPSVGEAIALESGATRTLIESLTNAIDIGDPAAGIMQTIVVFHDPNCVHCAAFKAETDALVEQGWRVRVIPVGITGEDAHGYASLMAAFATTRPDVVEALYRGAVPGEATVAKALEILQANGIAAPEALAAVSNSKAYEAIAFHNETLFRVGGQGTPTWVVADNLVTGGADAASITGFAATLAVPPGEVGGNRPGALAPDAGGAPQEQENLQQNAP
jgi:protein-disulfide isomerase